MLRGRPFGGVVILTKNNLRKHTVMVHCEERFAVVKVFNYLFINVYLPCSGTVDRLSICDNVLASIWSWRERYTDCECLVAGDFNVNLDSNDSIVSRLVKFVKDCRLVRCDDLFPSQKVNTYVNISLNHYSQIDYILVSAATDVINFTVSDPDINFSDHLPLIVEIYYDSAIGPSANRSDSAYLCKQLRWDRADTSAYYTATGALLSRVLQKLDNLVLDCESHRLDVPSCCAHIDIIYDAIVSILANTVDSHVPQRKRNFL